ncbi:MAG: hypothetical protein O3C21_01970 [Verrucomicrobia bacterium]|nr:hypothetical protein [Verrucomicrobiota bacterium]
MLAQNGSMLPYRCSTLLAPVSLPASIAQQPCFASNAISYLWKIFETWSRPFDVRVSVAEHQNGCKIVAAPQVFEEMVFDSLINSAQTVEAEFTVGEDADIHGFFLWLSLQCAPEAKRLDTLNTETNWFPVFFPIWPQSTSVQMGDRIEVTCNRSLSDDGIHPDYEISGSILPRNGSVRTFAWESFHHAQSFRCNGFYRALFGC